MSKQEKLYLTLILVVYPLAFMVTGFLFRCAIERPTKPVQVYFTFNTAIPTDKVEAMSKAAIKGILPTFKETK